MDKNFIYGIGKVTIGESEVGYIEKDSFDLGGTAGETVDINAEQVPGAPVLQLVQKNGTIAPTFNLIQLNLDNIKNVLGGKIEGKKWLAPSELINIQDKVKIETVSGAVIDIKKASVTANLTGKLALTETAKIGVTLKVLIPDDKSNPFSIDFTENGSGSQEESVVPEG
ncbi:MAG: hypothetical protein IJ190_10450 [Prevotella sp.]|nr:hypothetical protein [Prevotella sp.]